MIRKRSLPTNNVLIGRRDRTSEGDTLPSAPKKYRWFYNGDIGWFYLRTGTYASPTYTPSVLWHTTEESTGLPVIGLMNAGDPLGWYYDAEDIDSIVPYLLSLIRMGLIDNRRTT